jgi:exonuclease SbcC
MDQKEAQSKSLNTYKTWQDAKNPLLAYVALLEQNVQLKAELANSQQQKDQLFKGGSILKYRDDLKTKWTATHTHLATNQKSIKDNNELLESTTQQFNTLQSELVVKVTEAGFNSIEELSAAILPNNQVETIKRKQQQIQTNEIELSSNKKINEETLAAAKLQDDLPITLEEVNASISSLTNERDNHLSTLGQLQQQLLQHQQNKERIAGIIAQMSQMQQLQKHYATLNNMIGDSTGNKFNNIIQRITLRHLFNMTNQRLLTLMDRYQVDLGGDGQEDEIWVIDMYMGDEKRTINSVSGGERFVISLAMALALSDLASNNVKIDSLFIDEGFGSLSPEDLDNAISMLERMQVENEKTIGIISHVESLKERISTQIQVQKLQNGESTLQLKYNDKLVSLTV